MSYEDVPMIHGRVAADRPAIHRAHDVKSAHVAGRVVSSPSPQRRAETPTPPPRPFNSWSSYWETQRSIRAANDARAGRLLVSDAARVLGLGAEDLARMARHGLLVAVRGSVGTGPDKKWETTVGAVDDCLDAMPPSVARRAKPDRWTAWKLENGL